MGTVTVTARGAELLGDDLVLGRVTRSWAELEPANVNSVTHTAATSHTATAATAITAPGLARMLSHPNRLIPRGNIASNVESARRTTRRR